MKERDVPSFLKIDEELVAVEATLCWWGGRLVGYGQKRERGGLHMPQDPGDPGFSGQKEKGIICAFHGLC